jgi:CDP-diacylglycerol--serine O-phosphatidyltransferase
MKLKVKDRNRFRKTIYLLPNLFTVANMVLGIIAIIQSIQNALSLAHPTNILPFVWPARLILISIFMDFMDGRIARATHTTSKFGIEFDSLSDLVSFGVAPAILIYLSILRYLNFWGITIAVFYVICVAVRLARFNVQVDVEEKESFMGLPSPAAAGLIASYVLLSRWGGWYGKGIFLNRVMGWYQENIEFVQFIVIPCLMILISFTMISAIRYPSLKRLNQEKIKPITLVGVALIIFWIFYAAELTSFALLFFYLLWGYAHEISKNQMFQIKNKRNQGEKSATKESEENV